MELWSAYFLTYAIFAFTYLIYRYAFVLSYEENLYPEYKAKTSIIIPFYNETPKLLIDTINSALKCKGDNEIIVVDDGSTSKECFELAKQMSHPRLRVYRYEKNQGKRHAQVFAFKYCTGEIIMSTDSDTLLDKNSVLELIKPFNNPKVGATTGNLGVSNEKKNLLTRMIASRYWSAFNFERKSQGSLGVVVCCSGPISAYRKSLIDKITPQYLNQTFMGKQCTFGDDRHLTTLILKEGYNVEYVKNAIAYTNAPEKFKQFWKQQTRWRKSWLRETVIVSKFMFKRSKALTFEIILTTIIPFISLPARLMLIYLLLTSPLHFIYILPMLLLMISLHSVHLLIHRPKYYFYSLLYGLLHAFVLYWILFVAMWEFKNTGWGTR